MLSDLALDESLNLSPAVRQGDENDLNALGLGPSGLSNPKARPLGFPQVADVRKEQGVLGIG